MSRFPNPNTYLEGIGTEQDLYNYLVRFKLLEELKLYYGVMETILGLGLVVRYSPATLVNLTVSMEREYEGVPLQLNQKKIKATATIPI